MNTVLSYLEWVTKEVKRFTGWENITVELDEGFMLTLFAGHYDAPYPLLLLKYHIPTGTEIVGKLMYIGLDNRQTDIRTIMDV